MAGRPPGVHPLLLYQEGVKVKADSVDVSGTEFVCAQPGECVEMICRETERSPADKQAQLHFLCYVTHIYHRSHFISLFKSGSIISNSQRPAPLEVTVGQPGPL